MAGEEGGTAAPAPTFKKRAAGGKNFRRRGKGGGCIAPTEACQCVGYCEKALRIGVVFRQKKSTLYFSRLLVLIQQGSVTCRATLG